jgi:putative membrane protein
VAASVRDVNDRAQTASGQLDQLEAGSGQVASGARQLANATPELTAGIATATDGADQLAAGVEQLASGLAGGVERIPDASPELREHQAANIADPVQVETSAVTSAGTYGAGLAPFFVSLAAWIGMYALFLILKPVSARAMTALRTPVKVAVAGWLTPTLLGAEQMLALFGIVAGTLGFRVAHPWGAYGIMVLASMTFAAIILALNVWFGSVGQFMGLILMVLQLVVAGGTFPWQTLPEPLTSLHHLMPMSYAVDGLRQLMYGGDLSKAGSAAIVLACVLLGALVMTAIGVGRMMRSRTLRDLQPSLIG